MDTVSDRARGQGLARLRGRQLELSELSLSGGPLRASGTYDLDSHRYQFQLSVPDWRLAGLTLRVRSGTRLSECSPQAVLTSLEPRPLFFIHGGSDGITSVNHSRRLYDAYRGPREIWIVQGAPHTGAYFADRPLYVERVAGFFARHLGLDVSGHLRLVEEEEVS